LKELLGIFFLSFVLHAQDKLPVGVTFQLFTEEYKIYYPADPADNDPGGYNYGTKMMAEYRTPDVKNLEDYAVVQFIRGCEFYVQKTVSGQVVKDYYVRDFLGKKDQKYHFKYWVVDSVDSDPMYSNTPEGYDWGTRHGLYFWNKQADSFSQDTEVYYYEEKPTVPRLYVLDHPGTAFFMNDISKNISLQFKTCLYKIEDVPLKIEADTMDFNKALKCIDWSSSYIYNYETNQFDHPQNLDSYCL
jgi:hypothetical protein